MKVAVLGANGGLGRAVVDAAVGAKHTVTAVTRRAPSAPFEGAEQRTADVVTGEGLEAALAGADTVINAVNTKTVGDAGKLLVDGTRRVLEAAKAAGVSHYVAVSIVGIERVPVKYYAVKVAEEAVVAEGIVPWSLLRATQFHSFVDELFAGPARYGVVIAPAGVSVQPIDVRDVATLLVDAAASGPSGRLPDAGGPEVRLVKELARAWLAATKRTRVVLPVPVLGALGSALRAKGLCHPDRAVGTRTFEAWLRERYGA